MTSGVISIASVASFFVGLKPFRPIRTIAELWDVGKEGDSDPGEIDATRVNQYQTGQSEPPSAHGLVCTPSASDGHPTPGVGRGDSSSASYPADDVHQARSHRALEEGNDCVDVKKRDRCQYLKCRSISK